MSILSIVLWILLGLVLLAVGGVVAWLLTVRSFLKAFRDGMSRR
jgi:hypothetical protein